MTRPASHRVEVLWLAPSSAQRLLPEAGPSPDAQKTQKKKRMLWLWLIGDLRMVMASIFLFWSSRIKKKASAILQQHELAGTFALLLPSL